MTKDPHAEYRQHLVSRQQYLPPAARLPLRPDGKVPGPAGPQLYAGQLRRILAVMEALDALAAPDHGNNVSPMTPSDVLIPIYDMESLVEDEADRTPLGWLHQEEADSWAFVPAHTHEELTDLLHGHAVREPKHVFPIVDLTQ